MRGVICQMVQPNLIFRCKFYYLIRTKREWLLKEKYSNVGSNGEQVDHFPELVDEVVTGSGVGVGYKE